MVFAFLLAHLQTRPVIVVSPDGPLKTIASGITEADRQLSQNPAGVELQIHSGTYFLDQPITLSARDSNLHIYGIGKTLPRLVGGKRLMNWHAVNDPDVLNRLKPDARASVQECDLTGSDSVANLGGMAERGFSLPDQAAGLELFFNGKPMQMARYPNADDPAGGWLRISSVPSPTSITYSSEEPNKWKPSADLWALGYWQFDWAESYEYISNLDTSKKLLEFNGAHFVYPPLPGRRFYFLNVLEELDEPGEWYLDRQSHRLYFWPPTPIAEGEAIVSTMSSTMLSAKAASGLLISDLDLEAGRNGGIAIVGGKQNWVQHCLIRNFGTFGVSFQHSTDSGIKSCDLTGLGEFGISLDGGDRATLTPGDLVAEDNHVWQYARWRRTYEPAVSISGVGNRVAHNWIHDAPHQAILLSGNDHVIEYNDISNVCTETGDAGAIYMGRDTTMRGDVIQFNRFSQLSPRVNTEGNYTAVMGVYLDDCWAGATIFGNVFDMGGTGIMIGGGRDNTVANNVFLGCRPAIHFDARGKGWMAKYMAGPEFAQRIAVVHPSQPPYSTHYPKLASILSVDFAFPAGNAVDSNVSLGGTWMDLLDKLTTKDFENHDNVISQAPGSLDDALKEAPRSFRPIPVSDIGLSTKSRPSERVEPRS